MKSFCRCCRFVALGVGVAAAVSPLAASEIVRPATEGRVWQVNLNPAEPIRWPWETGAAFARLTITNHCTAKVSVETVTRTASDCFGSFALAVPETPEEQLYSLVLEQFHQPDAESEQLISTETARIVYLPGIHGAGVTVRPGTAAAMRESEPHVVFAYDAAWAGTSDESAAKITWAGESIATGERVLAGRSGFDAVSIGRGQAAELGLYFGETLFAQANVRNGQAGFVLIIR